MAWSFYLVLAIAGGIWLASRHDGFPIQWLAPGTWWQELPLGALAGGALLSLWHLGRRVLPHGAELEERLAEVV
ncbi:MAG TPA: hypothetical protein PK413_04500, partial [Thermoanaerobaculia bacterium]|nr:hypothetical protein [Thermoanaerobaculia bacterium]